MSDVPIKITLEPDKNAIDTWKKATKGVLSTSEFNDALAKAIKRAMAATRTQAFREVKERYTVKYGSVKNTVKLRHPSKSNVTGVVAFRGARIPLKDFVVKPRAGVKQKGVKPNMRERLFVQVKKDGGDMSRRGFVIKKRDNDVYRRKDGRQHVILKATGPSVVSMVGNEQAVEAIQARGNDILNQRIEHEMRRVLSK